MLLQKMPAEYLSEDDAYRQLSGHVIALSALLFTITLTFSGLGVYLNKARLTEIHSIFFDFKAAYHEYLAIHGKPLSDQDYMQFMEAFTEPVANITIIKYGVTDGTYWFQIETREPFLLEGVLTLKPIFDAPGLRVIWHCGYAADRQNRQAVQEKPFDGPLTTFRRSLLPKICR